MAKSNLNKYVVLADAIVVTTGKKPTGKSEYARLLRGGVLTASPRNEEVVTFLSVGAIKQVTSKAELDAAQADLAHWKGSRLRMTPDKARRASNSPEDPAIEAARDILPLTPDPDPQTAEQVDALVAAGREAVEAAKSLGDE